MNAPTPLRFATIDREARFHTADPAAHSTQGRVSVRELPMSERAQRTARICAILFGLACFSVILPVLHFLLVPGFLLAIPIVGGITFADERRATAEGDCPLCGSHQSTSEFSANFPVTHRCTGCSREFKITPAS